MANMQNQNQRPVKTISEWVERLFKGNIPDSDWVVCDLYSETLRINGRAILDVKWHKSGGSTNSAGDPTPVSIQKNSLLEKRPLMPWILVQAQNKPESWLKNLYEYHLRDYQCTCTVSRTCDTCSGRRTLVCSNCGQQGKIKCRNCNGRGSIEERCSGCYGQGRVQESYTKSVMVNGALQHIKEYRWANCWRCGARGTIDESCGSCGRTGAVTCDHCGGAGKYSCRSCGGSGALHDYESEIPEISSSISLSTESIPDKYWRQIVLNEWPTLVSRHHLDFENINHNENPDGASGRMIISFDSWCYGSRAKARIGSTQVFIYAIGEQNPVVYVDQPILASYFDLAVDKAKSPEGRGAILKSIKDTTLFQDAKVALAGSEHADLKGRLKTAGDVILEKYNFLLGEDGVRVLLDVIAKHASEIAAELVKKIQKQHAFIGVMVGTLTAIGYLILRKQQPILANYLIYAGIIIAFIVSNMGNSRVNKKLGEKATELNWKGKPDAMLEKGIKYKKRYPFISSLLAMTLIVFSGSWIMGRIDNFKQERLTRHQEREMEEMTRGMAVVGKIRPSLYHNAIVKNKSRFHELPGVNSNKWKEIPANEKVRVSGNKFDEELLLVEYKDEYGYVARENLKLIGGEITGSK